MKVTVSVCDSVADVAAIEATLPTGVSAYHQRRYERGAGSTYLLAWVDGVAVGHVLVTPESKYLEVRRELGLFPEVNGLGVAPAYQRRGVGRSLMNAALDLAKRMSGDQLGLAVEPDNMPAIQLYESLGFALCPSIDVVDVWSWIDDRGLEHERRDACQYWARAAG